MQKNNTINVGPGSVIQLDDQMFVITNFDTPDSVIVKNIATGLKSILKLADITRTYGNYKKEPKQDLRSIDESSWDKALSIFNALRPLLNNQDRTLPVVKEIADQLLVSPATIYRYLSKIESYGTVTCLLRKSRSDKNTKRLDPDVEIIIKNVIASEFMTDKKISPTHLFTEVKRLCRNAKLAPPSKQSVLKRIAEIDNIERVKTREGRNAALDFEPNRGSVPNTNRLYSLWQIDHTLVDIMLVDETYRIAIGRPWITLVMDIFCRMVIGWYISFDPPGSLGTGLSISRGILPKDEVLAKLGISFPWPCQGKPGIIMSDNAKEFRGNMLRNACAEHSIELKFRPVKKPNYGAHIERMLGTLLRRIHALDGTTFSNSQAKGEYDAEKNASMTLTEFEQWLANLILGWYHHEKHSALGCTPLQRYKEGLFGSEDTIGIGILPLAADPEKLRYDFMPFEERTIQPYGVVIDHIEYHDPVLDKWIGALEPNKTNLKRKFIFRRDPRDISFIIFWDPDVKQYYRIAYRDTRHPAISLWELRAILRFLNENSKDEISEENIFKALNEMRSLEESSKVKTKKTRLAQERRRFYQKVTSPTSKASKPALVDESHNHSTETGSEIDFGELTAFDEVEPM